VDEGVGDEGIGYGWGGEGGKGVGDEAGIGLRGEVCGWCWSGGCGGSKVVTVSGRGHSDVTPEGGATDRWMMTLVLKILLVI
jgi:hypothetical protein